MLSPQYRDLLLQGYHPDDIAQMMQTQTNGGFAGPGSSSFDPSQFVQPSQPQAPPALGGSPIAATGGGQAAPPASLQDMIPKPAPATAQKFTAKLSDGTTVSGENAQEWLKSHQMNPKAAEINELNVKGQQAKAMADFYRENAEPKQEQLTPGAMPIRDQVQTPHEGQAQLNPLAVLLGLATGFGGAEGNPAQAIADQAHAAMSQTHANFQSAMQEAGFAADQAAAKYHDDLTAHNEKLKVQAANNDINFANASSEYKQREGIKKLDAQASGSDTLSAGLTKIGQMTADREAVENSVNAQAAQLPTYLKEVGEASKVDQANVETAHTAGTEQRAAQLQPFTVAEAAQKVQTGELSLKQAAVKLGLSVEDLKQKMVETQHAGSMANLAEEGARLGNEGKVLGNAKTQVETANAKRQGQLTDLNVALKRIELSKADGPDNADIKQAMDLNDGQRDAALNSLKMAQKPYQDAIDARMEYYTKATTPGKDGNAPGLVPKVYRMYESREQQAAQAYNTAKTAYDHAEQLHTINAQKLGTHMQVPLAGAGGQGAIQLDKATAAKLLQEAGGNPQAARALAIQRGYKF